MTEERELDLAGRVIGLAMKVHRTLGPGFLESVYENALAVELERNAFVFERQKPLQVRYEGVVVGEFVADLAVEGSLIVELKAVSTIVPAHEMQLVNYLTATGTEDGLLLNFGAASLEFKRKYRTYRPARAKELVL
jgi:GxxExxY protein